MVEIQINNTLTGQKERFTPLKAHEVGIYACGVTVYDDCHIGHAMQAIYFDVIRRYFEFLGNKVTYVRNYTDVDDKIIVRAQKLGISPRQLADDMVNASKRSVSTPEPTRSSTEKNSSPPTTLTPPGIWRCWPNSASKPSSRTARSPLPC